MKIDVCLITESNLQSILEKSKNNRVKFSFRSWRKWSDMKITGYFTETTQYTILYFIKCIYHSLLSFTNCVLKKKCSIFINMNSKSFSLIHRLFMYLVSDIWKERWLTLTDLVIDRPIIMFSHSTFVQKFTLSLPF